MNELTKYQYTRTIRFKLEPLVNTDKRLKLNTNKELQLIDFINMLDRIKKEILDILIYHKVKVKYTWLRSYLKNDFYDYIANLKAGKEYEVNSLRFFKEDFENRWSVEWDEVTKQLRDYNNRPLEELTRKPNIALLINQISSKTNFEYIKEFVGSLTATNIVDVDKKVEDLKLYLNQANKIVKSFQDYYLPYQSNGVMVAGGSFNYYTVNKTTKFENGLKKQQDKLNAKLTKTEQFMIDLGLKEELIEKTIDETYHFLKKWKAEKKSHFLEKAQAKNLTFRDTYDKNEFYLFHSSQANFDNFITLTNKIEELATKRNNKDTPAKRKTEIRDEIIKKKKERGKFFNAPKAEVKTKNYKNFCEFYKRIALKRGHILTAIKAIEKEKITADQINHWCFIVDKNEKQILYIIPRKGDDNLKKVKEYLERFGNDTVSRTGEKLYYFESLTLPALRKLCFKTIDNTFAQSLKGKGLNFPEYEQALNEEGKVKFYQKVLQYAKETGDHDRGLNLQSYNQQELDELCLAKIENLEEFEQALSKICYVKTIIIPKDLNKNFNKKFEALSFEITSYDLTHSKKGDSKFVPKEHTSIWYRFWSEVNTNNDYPLRLNPEIKVSWRDALPSRIKKYGKGSSGYDITKNNRYLQPQYTLMTTFTENAFEKRFDFSFTDTNSIKEAVDYFNKDLADKNNADWHYGIDRGTKELATLCISKFDSTGDKLKVKFPKDIKLYKLKSNRYFYKTQPKKGETIAVDKGHGGPIKNVSYCLDKINNEKWFDLIDGEDAACFDLTSAKVIKGHIILNGDLMTLLALKKIVAQRQIFELFHQGKIDKNAKITTRGGKSIFISIEANGDFIRTDRSDDEHKNGIIIYRFTEDQKADFEKKGQPIVDFLNLYLQGLDQNRKTKNEPPIDKINHLRDSLTANMVGIIKFLHAKYPAKIISLENLDELKKTGQKFITSHFYQSEVSISRRLEWALYRTFQPLSLVPPGLKETILLKDEFKQQQFGVIKFIETKGTSSNCPVCDNEYHKTGNHYICSDTDRCGFSSKNNMGNLIPLTNSDKVAAYNIAKRGYIVTT